jgi:hypothetical protein
MKLFCGHWFGGLFAVLLVALSISSARAQNIFVTERIGTIGEYTTAGAPVNPALVLGLSDPTGIAFFVSNSGSELFVAKTSGSGAGTIGAYSATTGMVINPALISGLNVPEGIAVSGSDLFVANTGAQTIGEYTTTGGVVNAALISGFNEPWGIAVSGSDLFVADTGFGRIGEYDATTGATVNAALISGLVGPTGVAVSGSDLFVANLGSGPGTGTIGEYTTTGQVVNAALISGLNSPEGVAVSGSDLFFTNSPGTIGVYDIMTGKMEGSISVGGPQFIAIEAALGAPAAAPEPSTLALLGAGLAGLAFHRRKRTH